MIAAQGAPRSHAGFSDAGSRSMTKRAPEGARSIDAPFGLVTEAVGGELRIHAGVLS